jgi:hypothetical protein
MRGALTINKAEVDLEVVYDYTHGCRGQMYLSNGDPGFPDEPPEVEIEKVLAGGVDIIGLIAEEIHDELRSACLAYEYDALHDQPEREEAYA